MQNFLISLLTGLTTVFAWTPATILLVMSFIGIYTGLVYFEEMDVFRLILLCLLTVLGIAGYLGLTSICWGLKLTTRTKLVCLICGIMALSSVILIGYMSENELLHISFNIEEIYLFICPLVFLLLHTLLVYRNSKTH